MAETTVNTIWTVNLEMLLPPQGSAVVSGSGVYTGSQVAGSPRSSSDNREGTGVASLAPATQNATSADVGKSRHALHDGVTKATKALGRALRAQGGGLESLLGKAAYLESLKDKLRSEQAKEAIKEVLTVIMEMKENREKVTRAFNVVVAQVQADSKRAATTAETVPISRSDAGTQSPCWWDTATPGVGLPAQPARTLVEVGEAASAPKSPWSEVVRKKGQKAKTLRTGGDTKAAGNLGKTLHFIITIIQLQWFIYFL